MTIDEFQRLDESTKCRAVAVAIAQDLDGRLLVTSGMLARVSTQTEIRWIKSREFSRLTWLEVGCR